MYVYTLSKSEDTVAVISLCISSDCCRHVDCSLQAAFSCVLHPQGLEGKSGQPSGERNFFEAIPVEK